MQNGVAAYLKVVFLLAHKGIIHNRVVEALVSLHMKVNLWTGDKMISQL